jgi:hypothetical protein
MTNLVIKVPLPSPLVGGRARRNESASAPVMAAIEEFRADVGGAARDAMTPEQLRAKPLFEDALIRIDWVIGPHYVVPQRAESCIRLGLEDMGVIGSSRAHAKRVTVGTHWAEQSETGLVITVEEG